MTDTPLAGFGVLVTRPHSQATELIAAIQSAGGTALHFPAIEIVPRKKIDIEKQLANAPAADIALFVSPNAVEFGRHHIGSARVAAVGPATAAALQSIGCDQVIVPDSGYDSESLLLHPALQDVHGTRVMIVRGQDGRELLADTLRERGADVFCLSVYDRKSPDPGKQSLDAVESAWRDGQIGAIVVMSVATLHNLVNLLPEWCQARFAAVPLVTPAARVIKEALELYPASTPVKAAGPQLDDMLEAIISIHRNDTGHAT